MSTLNWLGLVPLGIAVIWSKGIILRSQHVRLDPHVALLLNTVGWVLVWIGILGPVLLFPLGILLAPLLIVIALAVIHRYRESQRNTLLWILGVATESGLPLSPLIRSFAEESQSSLSPRFQHFSRFVEQGVPLPDALQQSGNRIPTELMLAARMGTSTTQLGTGLKKAAYGSGEVTLFRVAVFQWICYIATILLVSLGMITFAMIKLVPTMEMLFADFEIELPPVTEWMISIAHAFALYWFLASPILLLVFGCLPIACLYYIGWLHWEPPGIRRLTQKYHGAIIMQALSNCTEEGIPLPHALQTVARHHPKPHIQRLLHVALQEIDRGRSWSDSLCAVGLIRKSHASLLSSAERVGNLPWALREMAECSHRQMDRRIRGILTLLVPGLLVLCAVPIALFAVGMIAPLARLIQNLT